MKADEEGQVFQGPESLPGDPSGAGGQDQLWSVDVDANGLKAKGRDERGRTIRKAGIMGIDIADGEVRPGDPIRIELPGPPCRSFEPV